MFKKPTHKPLKKLVAGLFIYLCISSSTQASDWIYTVEEGDTLWRLSTDFLVEARYWRKLQRLNGVIDPKYLKPGSKLRIPLQWSRVKPTSALVENVTGDVSVINASSGSKPVNKGMQLQAGDKLKTGDGASVSLSFGDGSRMILREQSDLLFEKLESYGNENAFNTQIKLNNGRTSNQVNPEKKQGSRFEIHTPSATAAVRGTTYRVSASDTATTSEVLEGEVELLNDQGNVELPKGFGSRAKPDQPSLPPQKLLAAPDFSQLPKRLEGRSIILMPAIYKAHSYRIQIAKDASFQALDLDKVTRTPRVNISAFEDGEYNLKVRGIDVNQLEGFDALHHFVINNHPAAPVLLRPLAKASVNSNYNTFTWIESAGISNYRFQLADNVEFNQPLVDTSEVDSGFIRVNKKLNPGQWYWRVAAIDPVEGVGPFANASSFWLEKPKPETNVSNTDVKDQNLLNLLDEPNLPRPNS